MIPIRWKLLIVLLATALVPLLFVARVGQQSTSDLGNQLANDTRSTLIDAADRQLRQVVTAQSRYLSDRESKVLLLLRLQALEAERLLAASTTPRPGLNGASTDSPIAPPAQPDGGEPRPLSVPDSMPVGTRPGGGLPTDELPEVALNLPSSLGVLANVVSQAAHSAYAFGSLPAPAPWQEPARLQAFFDYQYNADFANPDLRLVELPRYRRIRNINDPRPLPVSLTHGVVLLAPDVSPWTVSEDIRALVRLTPFYRAIWTGANENFLWLYTTLASGVHFSYPGHGGFPDDFDPRTRMWYQRSLETSEPGWTVAQLDATTERAVFTASMPIHHPDGTVAGVTGLDLPVIEIIGRVDLPEPWREHARVMMVSNEVDEDDLPPGGGPAAITILARQEYAETTASWRTQIELETLTTDDPRAQSRLVQGLLSGQPGTMTWPYEGRMHQVAYAPLPDASTFLIILIPVDVITLAAERVRESAIARTRQQVLTTGIVIAIVAVLVILVSFIGSKAVTRPVLRLTELARRIARGDFAARAEIRTRDELELLGRSFNNMVPQLEERVRLRQSLLLAMDVQQALLPKGPPPLREFEIAGSSIYCDETGGDYFDYIPIGGPGGGDEDEDDGGGNGNGDVPLRALAIAVGDVTGHGASAAMLMTTGRALLRSRLQQPGSLAEVVGDVNRLMSADAPYGRFMTLFLLRIDLDANEMQWVSAGHEPACRFGAGATQVEHLDGVDIPLGIRADWRFEARRGPLPERGQFIFIGTDAIWEARNPARDMFGRDRLHAVMRKHSHGSAEDLRVAVVQAVDAHQAGAAREDDVTLVVIRRM